MNKLIQNVFVSSLRNFQFNRIKYVTSRTVQTDSDDRIDLEKDSEYELIACRAMNIKRTYDVDENILIIMPYVKWGGQKSNPDLQLQEAISLVQSLPKWKVIQNIKVPLQNFNKKTFFGKGKLVEIGEIIKTSRNSPNRISAVFISKNMLDGGQKIFLEQLFHLPVFDRYSIVIQILRQRSISNESKLQVAMAEIPYIKSYYRDLENTKHRVYLDPTQRHALQMRENKLKSKLAEVRAHRELLRNKRKRGDFPIVAIVGYTNAGKTNLIKTITGLNNLEPKDQLFATLDVTAYAGLLPSHLKVIYIDTVGFISDIPTTLLECFVATLEDVIFADLIIHVHDISHPNVAEQKNHVEETLRSFLVKYNIRDTYFDTNVINVGNKCDLVVDRELPHTENTIYISSTKLIGINQLLDSIEDKILKATNRFRMMLKVPMGGEEATWLYKNATVANSSADPKNQQLLVLNVVISELRLNQFKKRFIVG